MKIIIIGFIRVVIMLAAFLHEMHARECLRKHVLINIPEFIEPSGTVVISINGIILESKIQDLSKLIEAYDKQNMTVVYRGYGSHDKIKDEILEIETHRKLIQNIHLSTNYIDRTLYYGKIQKRIIYEYNGNDNVTLELCDIKISSAEDIEKIFTLHKMKGNILSGVIFTSKVSSLAKLLETRIMDEKIPILTPPKIVVFR